MGVMLYDTNANYVDGRVTYYCDSSSDIATLSTECAVGSIAIVIGDGSGGDVYILNAEKQWRKF